MIKDDRIYQVLLKYNFDLFRGDKNITEYMRAHCKQYYCDILDAVQGENPFLEEGFVNLLKGELEELQGICSIIPEILELNDGACRHQYHHEYLRRSTPGHEKEVVDENGRQDYN